MRVGTTRTKFEINAPITNRSARERFVPYLESEITLNPKRKLSKAKEVFSRSLPKKLGILKDR
jgi:hypothetical protein